MRAEPESDRPVFSIRPERIPGTVRPERQAQDMEEMTQTTIGIDVSKDRLDAYRLPEDRAKQFGNDKKGCRDLLTWIGPKAVARVVYEATGAYHRQLESALARAGLPLAKAPPTGPSLRRNHRCPRLDHPAAIKNWTGRARLIYGKIINANETHSHLCISKDDDRFSAAPPVEGGPRERNCMKATNPTRYNCKSKSASHIKRELLLAVWQPHETGWSAFPISFEDDTACPIRRRERVGTNDGGHSKEGAHSFAENPLWGESKLKRSRNRYDDSIAAADCGPPRKPEGFSDNAQIAPAGRCSPQDPWSA